MRRARMDRLKKLKPLTLALILVLSFAVEALMSNYVYFAYVSGTEVTDYRSESMPESVDIAAENDYFTVENLGFEVSSVTFAARSYGDETAVNVDIFAKTDPEQDSFSLVSSQETVATESGKKSTLYFGMTGECDSLYIAFSGFDVPFSVSDLTVNEKYSFNFNLFRFIVVFALIAGVYFCRKTGAFKALKSMSAKDAAFFAVSLTLIASLAVSLLNFSDSGAMTEYPLENDVRYYNPYVQQFDALRKGQLHLDVEPSQELLELENPYDYESREGVDYMWDRAFYDGKYYSYFGLTPIITVFYPVYLLTGALPSLTLVTSIFSAMTAVFFALAVMEWAKLRKARSSPAFEAFCAVSAFLASQTLLMQRGNSQFYYVAGITAMAFVSAFMFWMLKAIGSPNLSKRAAFYALAGVSFGFAFHARVNTALPFAIISAVFVVMLLIKRVKEKKLGVFAAEAVSLGLPVLIAVALSLYYNYLRFGSFFEFGTTYQLTVADTSLYELNAAGIAPSIFHYFLQQFNFSTEFPYIAFERVYLGNYNGYVYVDSGLGIFAFAFTLLLLLSPAVFKSKGIDVKRKILLASAIASLFVTAFADFCLGGVIFRYTADISLLAAFLSAVIALEAAEHSWDKHGEGAAKMLKYGVAVLGAVTLCTAAASTLIRHTNMLGYSPSLYAALKEFFVFR